MIDSISVVMPVFEDGARALAAIRSLLTQDLPSDMLLEIVVVDDGSRDSTATLIAGLTDERVELVRSAENRGRSEARNLGARRARSPFLVFIDSDCMPATDRLLVEHAASLRMGAVASVGFVAGSGEGFWDRYQWDASLRRERQFRNGCTYSGSSQNLAVLKSAFEEIGGFDTGFRNYGFEDRDLLLRLADNGDIVWTRGAGVRHLDAVVLGAICRKMAESGETSAGRFAERHPAAYRALGYAAFDCRRRPWLKPLASLLGPGMPRFAERIEPLLHMRWIPYPLRKGIVKLASGLSFLYGTKRAAG
jgi:glycosyltransferase involved in cell wall biosynthesis